MSRHWAPFGRCLQYPVRERIQRPAQIRARPPARDLETWQNRRDHWRHQDHLALPTAGLDAYDRAWELTQRLHQTVDSPANLAACEVAEAELDRPTSGLSCQTRVQPTGMASSTASPRPWRRSGTPSQRGRSCVPSSSACGSKRMDSDDRSASST